MLKSEFNYSLKIVMLGDSGVGKTTLLMRYCDSAFTFSHIATIGVDFKYKAVTVNGKKAKVIFWDTAGQERFRTITSAYYRGSNGTIIMFDLTNRESFKNVNQWCEDVAKYANKDTKLLLIGSKADQESKRVVSYDEGWNLANKYNIKYFEVSSLNNINVSESIESIINEICADIPVIEPVIVPTKVELTSFQLYKEKCCGSKQ
jgi:small GTP-binding protein